MNDTRNIWWSATLNEGAVVYFPKPVVAPHQPGTAAQQLEVARMAADNPWHFVDPADAYRAARRTVLRHARRAR